MRRSRDKSRRPRMAPSSRLHKSAASTIGTNAARRKHTPLVVMTSFAASGASCRHCGGTVSRGRTPAMSSLDTGGSGFSVGTNSTSPLIAVEDAVFVAIDTDAKARSRRNTGQGDLTFNARGQPGELRQRDRRVPEAVGQEQSRSVDESASTTLRDNVALALCSSVKEQLNPGLRVGPVAAGQRDLLTDDRREIAVERQHELLDLTPLEKALRRQCEAVGVPRIARTGGPLHEEHCAVKTIQRVDRTVVQEAEAANLIAHEGVVGAGKRFGQEERRPRHAEFTDFLVHVAQVGNLENLGLSFE